jgi:hypothetical protein
MVVRPRRRRRTRAELAVVAAGVLAAVAFPAWLVGGGYLKHRAERVALARAWSIDGRPCPQVSAEVFAERGLRAPKGLAYANATIFRQFGHMACSPIAYQGGAGFGSYAVCQFTGPNVLRVKTRKGEWFFVPGPGQPATVATPHGEAHCVLASNFRL